MKSTSVNPTTDQQGQQGAFPLAAGSLSLTIRLEREDDIPAFGAFFRCEEQHDESPVIVLNVQALMAPECEDEQGNPVPLTREERKRMVITTLMHEFGHALESHFGLPVNEEHIEKACADWERISANISDVPIPAHPNLKNGE